MKTPLNITRISAGRLEDNGMLYASALVIDENQANTIETDRIDCGSQVAKVQIDTSDNNKLAREMALSGLVPGELMCDVSTSVKKNVLTMTINGFVKG
jgi:hypothetical protein